jgi:hypothetical protein
MIIFSEPTSRFIPMTKREFTLAKYARDPERMARPAQPHSWDYQSSGKGVLKKYDNSRHPIPKR